MNCRVKKEGDLDLKMDIDEKEIRIQYVEETQIEYASSNLEDSDEIATNSPNVSVADVSLAIDDDRSLEKTNTGGKRGSKKRKVTDLLKNGAESVLRRSARRRAILCAQDNDPISIKYDDALPCPVLCADLEDQPTISGCEESEEMSILSTKLELPPSTGNMDLDGLPVLDLFSVYVFLRSFSTVLFLSPFGLGDFVVSIRSKSPSLLIDSIHVSLLRVLRKHLEVQASESSISATNCLRDLNWDLLDLITWPIFMVEYLLMKPGFDLFHLKLFKTDYYKQPEVVKLEMLRYICDDVIEGEDISSELSRRILVGDSTNVMEPDVNTQLMVSKKRREKMSNSGSCMNEEVIDETADWNSDECCLCKMDGNLICCDGCPAAFHSKCVGIAANLLPDGDWYCPECVVNKKNPEINVVKSIRGADLLGVDPHGRLYYSSCGYLLVSNPCDAETPFRYYHMNDLSALINALNLLNGPYRSISNAITNHWRSYIKIYGEKANLDSENASSFVNPLLKLATNSPETCAKDETLTEDKLKNVGYSTNGYNITETAIRKDISQQLEIAYLNLYSFARVASSVAGEWTRKPLDKASQTPSKSLEELISIQMKVISKTSVDFCWSNLQNLSVDARKEKCGWCLACKFPTDDGNCLFFMNNPTVLESFTSELLNFGSRISRNDRLIDIMCHILYIEDRLHGLLLGPWLNPHFTKLYRKSFLEASDIVPVKDLLLMLESNIQLRAISDEWLKHVDSVLTVGSASHVVTSKLRMESRNVTGRKRSSCLESEPHSSKNLSTGLGLFWWRGGRLTRQLFNWKVLPRSLVRKAARHGGGQKIDGILYPENSDFPKRSKALVWRASVESAVTLEQLALQIRELDANIKWEEIENTTHLAKMDKESLKSMRSFKKSIIRRKSLEGSAVKYLLDFGKRRFIPDTIVKHGSKLQEATSERKKYWVEEPYVPLFLLKAFEDKRISLKSNKTSLSSLQVGRRVVKPSKEVGFSYLFSKAERSENHGCGYCNKDLLVRDAISCQDCQGFFHKRHVKKTNGGTYTCHKCHADNIVKASPKKGKLRSQKTKKVSKITKKCGKGKHLVQTQASNKGFVVPLRRSTRKVKTVLLQTKKKPVKKKKKQLTSGGKKKNQLNSAVVVEEKAKGKRGRPRKIKKESFKKRRSQVLATYWLNGLLLSRRPDDDRVADFSTKNHLVPFERLDSITDQPKCCLCHEPEFRSSLKYISCETCRGWYHGDAFGLNDEHIGIIIGFKCHKCRERPPPICPHLDEQKGDDVLSSEVLFKKKSDTIEEDHAADAQNGPESATHNNTMNLGPTGTLIEPCETNSSSVDVLLSNISDPDNNLSKNGTLIELNSSSRDVLLENMPNQDKGLSKNATFIEPCEENSSSKDVLLENMPDQDKDLSKNATFIEPCEKSFSSRDVLLANTFDQDKDLSKNATFIEPCEENSSSKDVLLENMPDQDKDLSKNGTLIEPREENSSSRNVLPSNMSDQHQDLSKNATFIELCAENSSSKDVLLENMPDQDKDLSKNGTLIEPREETSSSRDVLPSNMSDQHQDLSKNATFIELCAENSSSKDVLLENMPDQDKDLSENGSFKPKDSNTSDAVQEEENEDIKTVWSDSRSPHVLASKLNQHPFSHPPIMFSLSHSSLVVERTGTHFVNLSRL